MPNLAIIYPSYDMALPFRSVTVTASGISASLVGNMWYTNSWSRGVVSGTFPAATNWSQSLPLPNYGQYTFTVYGSNALGAIMQDTVRFQRKASRVYWLTSP